MKTFIYLLVFGPNKGYVGKSNNPIKRLSQHKTGSKKNKTYSQRTIAKLIRENKEFDLKILEEVDFSLWKQRESFWITQYKNNGWTLTNHTSGGDGLHNPDEETLERIRCAAKARYSDPVIRKRYEDAAKDPERCKKISDALAGKKKTIEHINNLPQNQKGFRFSEERNAKIGIATSIRNLQRAKDGAYTPLSEEHKLKISKANKGKPIGLGRKLSESHKESISVGSKGKPKSKEWKKKASEAAKARWAKVRQSKLNGENNE